MAPEVSDSRRALQERRAELEQTRTNTEAELRAWRQDEAGFTSVSRTARAAKALVTDDHSLKRFVLRVNDPESDGESPLRLRLRTLDERLALADQAL